MKRSLFVIALLLLSVGYLFVLGWTGHDLATFAAVAPPLTLEQREPRTAALTDVVSLELTGSGFSTDSQVVMHMDVNNQDAVVRSFPLDEVVFDLEVVDNYLFVAGNKRGMTVFDVSDAGNPKMLATRNFFNGPILDIERNGDALYLSCGAQGVKMASLGGRFGVKPGRSLNTWTAAIASKVVGHFLYVIAGKGKLLVYDLEKPDLAQPVFVVESDHYFKAIDRFDRYLYTAVGKAGVQIYKIDSTGLPVLTGVVPPQGGVRSVTVANGFLYVLEGDRVRQYALAQPGAPRLLAEQRHFPSPRRLYYAGETLYVTDNASGLGLIDNRKGLLPPAADILNVGGDPRAMALVGPYLYVAVHNAGIKLIDPQAILPRQVVRTIQTPGSVARFTISGDYIYLDIFRMGIFRQKIADPTEDFRLISPGRFKYLAVAENHLYVVGGLSGLEVFRTTGAATPELVRHWPEITGTSAAIDGDYLVVGHSAGGLSLLNISSLDRASVVASLPDVLAAQVFIRDDLVIVAGRSEGVNLYRIENEQLIFLNQIKLPFPLDKFAEAVNIKVVGQFLYVANGYGGMMIVDIDDPLKPQLLSSVSLPGFVNDLLVEDATVYVTSRYGGLSVVDVSNLKSPQLISSVKMPDLHGGIERNGDLLYLGNFQMGVSAVPLPRRVPAVAVLSENKLQVTIPPPKFPGRYSIQVSNKEGVATSVGVLRYQ